MKLAFHVVFCFGQNFVKTTIATYEEYISNLGEELLAPAVIKALLIMSPSHPLNLHIHIFFKN